MCRGGVPVPLGGPLMSVAVEPVEEHGGLFVGGGGTEVHAPGLVVPGEGRLVGVLGAYDGLQRTTPGELGRARGGLAPTRQFDQAPA